MKKLILIFLIIPYVSYAQEIKTMTTQDLVINLVLESTVNYLVHRNNPSPTEYVGISSRKDSLDWSSRQLIKWQIIEAKDSVKIIYDD